MAMQSLCANRSVHCVLLLVRTIVRQCVTVRVGGVIGARRFDAPVVVVVVIVVVVVVC
jgi:hypothetical protein